jgi:hypothetical protein
MHKKTSRFGGTFFIIAFILLIKDIAQPKLNSPGAGS